MNALPLNKKYAWREIPRRSAPKRGAAERVADFREIYTPFDEAAIREQASRCIQCGDPLCRTGCPLSNRIPEWMALTAEGEFLEAAKISALTSNMPEICSRVCPQERLCENACIMNSCSEPIAIGAVEKFITEYAFAHGGVDVTVAPSNGFRVAVIGSGPGGLACADELAKVGCAVTVFEAQSIPGGLLVNGIPSFKLDKRIVARRINILQRRGICFHLNTKVGIDVSFTELRKNFDAIFIGIGAQKPKALDVPGAELAGIYDALPFLIGKNVSASNDIDVKGKHVAVLGGGDTAMDCLRTALRSGALEATCIYRRDLANMPGSRKEYVNAVEEGAQFRFLTNPVSLEGENGQVKRVCCVRMELGEPDASGRRKPRPEPGSEFLFKADVVIVAYGFDPFQIKQWGFEGVAINEWGGITVDTGQMTSVPGVFAGGDSSRGPSLVVHAVRDARKAAASIHAYLATGSKT
ncbi:MAG: gltD [Verrucomicrobiales bacterium]|nr:gltD [Verrucomicrobiales bacterium]